MIRDLLCCLGFLTRLGPARAVTPEALGRTLPWFGVTGLLVGALAAAPAAAFSLLTPDGPSSAQAATAGLAWVFLLTWLTRGLHWDGLADLADAWGSGARGERFWSIMKDSRAGAFAVLGVALFVAAQTLLAREAVLAGGWMWLVWAPAAGRATAAALAWLGRDLGRPGLAQAFLGGATLRAVAVSAFVAILGGVLVADVQGAALAAVFAVITMKSLHCLARSQGAMNGDFLGAAVIIAETGTLAAVCVL